MATFWLKDPSGNWVSSQPAVRTATGWLYGRLVYVKTGASTWTLRWSRDVTAPAAPVVQLAMTGNTLIYVRITAPVASDLAVVRVKVSTTGYVNSYSTTDGHYYSDTDSTGEKWSEWAMTSGQIRAKNFPPAGKVNAGTTYYFTAFAQDTSYNWSAAGSALLKVPVPTTPTPTVVHKSAWISPVDSASYEGVQDYWRTDSNYVYQGGPDYRGMWFYGTRIQATLAKATAVTKMQAVVQRVNTVHGVNGASHVNLAAHNLASQPGGDPASGWSTAASHVGDVLRGQKGTFNIPSGWWPYFKSGGMKGIGLRAGSTSYTDVNYMYAYGAGTDSGKIYIEWDE